MDIRNLDLNLLVVFDALLRTRSVTRAAADLDMSQPAASFALNKLRTALGDPLFVRTSRGIQPTPRAEQLAAPLADILDDIRTRLLQQPTFAPEQAERTITFNMPDIGELVFLPSILNRLAALAPKLSIQTVNLPDADIEPALQSGAVDLALGYFPRLQSAALYQQRLFTHSFVCIVRRNHPRIRDKISRRQFVENNHGVVGGSHMDEWLDAELREQGLIRRIVLRVEHFLALPMILSESELIFTVPYAIGAELAKLADVKLIQPPFKVRSRVVKQHWHSRFHNDAANRWVRGIVADLFLEKRCRSSANEGRSASGRP
jgi:DNA-binding transcriptional LysR family regulator